MYNQRTDMFCSASEMAHDLQKRVSLTKTVKYVE